MFTLQEQLREGVKAADDKLRRLQAGPLPPPTGEVGQDQEGRGESGLLPEVEHG